MLNWFFNVINKHKIKIYGIKDNLYSLKHMKLLVFHGFQINPKNKVKN